RFPHRNGLLFRLHVLSVYHKQVTPAQIHDCHPPSSLRNLSLFQMQKQLLLPAFQFPSKNTHSSLITSPMTIACSHVSFNNHTIDSSSCSDTTNNIQIDILNAPYISSNVILDYYFKNGKISGHSHLLGSIFSPNPSGNIRGKFS